MRNSGWLQRLLYLIMIVLGIYIFYKGGGMLLQNPAARRALETGVIQQSLEDAALRTLAPGYTAAVEGRNGPDWMAGWMSQAVPVFSYVLSETTESEESTEKEVQEDRLGQENGNEKENRKDNGAGTTDENAAAGVKGTEKQQVHNTGANEITVSEAGNNSIDSETENEMVISETESKMIESETENETMVSETEHEKRVSDSENEDSAEAVMEAAAIPGIDSVLREQLRDFQYLLNNYYTVDGGTMADEELLDADVLLDTDLSLTKNPDVPQILIYHTHAQEAFADSREGVVEDTIVGMGEVLAEHLRSCGYTVIHDTGVYDLINGVLDRSAAYDYARESVQQILEEHPTIEVIIDLHRDGVDGKKFVTEIGGKPCSMIMFFNGISRNNLDQPLYWLENPYIQENLAFSLQMQLAARDKYPDFTRNIYLKAERFNLHLRPRSLLIEAGTQLNTVEEERNAMEPLAELLNQVLTAS